MAISVVSVATCAANAGAFTTITPSSSIGRSADVVYVFGGCLNGSTALASIGPTSNSASAGSSFTRLVASSTAALGVRLGLWRRTAYPTTNAVSLSSSYTTSAAGYGILILRGVASTSQETVTTVVAGGASSTPQSGAIVPTTPNSMILSIIGQMGHSSGMTGPTGFSNVTVATTTLNGTIQFTVGVATFLTTSTASTAPGAWTSTVSTSWLALTVSARPYTPPTSSQLSVYYSAEAFVPIQAQ